ncbi:MAG: LysR family transcriptional regulator [Lachnospiraceae bacterium]|nr:LysR family transcriptional regulator [Lachnospiraceae bacterium]
MNIMQIKYAVEVARYGSINKAAEALYIAQPNLSRYIRELENDLGITIFKRTYRGMVPTPDGEIFLRYARQIQSQIDDIERLYKGERTHKQRFSISVPRASYIADAFVQFSRRIDVSPTEIYYMETNTRRAVQNMLESDYRLGIIRYAADNDTYFKSLLDDKGIASQLVADFTYVLLMSGKSPLAAKEDICYSDLDGMIEIAHGDPFVPSMQPASHSDETQDGENAGRSIFLFERGGQFDLLCENEQTYMLVSPIPDKLLKRYGLIQRPCLGRQRVYRDVLIHRKEYELTELDRLFIAELTESKRRTLPADV